MDKKTLLSLIDLTSLNENDTPAQIEALCKKAVGDLGAVAAVCVYPQFINQVKNSLENTSVLVATVVNFPEGKSSLSDVLTEVETALAAGADEIDMVIPYQDYLYGNKQTSLQLVKHTKALCTKHTLKVILETSVFQDLPLIYNISCDALEAGADFIKTSTGKTAVGATLPAAAQMLQAIKDTNPGAGFKASGGIKTPEQAWSYYTLAAEIMGHEWCVPQHLRLGASSLLDNLYDNDHQA